MAPCCVFPEARGFLSLFLSGPLLHHLVLMALSSTARLSIPLIPLSPSFFSPGKLLSVFPLVLVAGTSASCLDP